MASLSLRHDHRDLPMKVTRCLSCFQWELMKLRTLFLTSLVCLFLFVPYAGAKEAGSVRKRETPWHNITFISLKQGNSIRNARFMLLENGTLAFEIKGEPLKITKNVYKYENSKFTATVAFDLKKGKPYHYVVTFDGFGVAHIYAGTAVLQEYNANTLTQKLRFLFFATPEETSPQKDKKPFFFP